MIHTRKPPSNISLGDAKRRCYERQTKRKTRLSLLSVAVMQTSKKMMMGLFLLATLTLVYWGAIGKEKSWASNAMTTSSTVSTESRAASIRSKRVFCFGDSLTAGTSPPSHVKFPYATYLNEALQKQQQKSQSQQQQEGSANAKISVVFKGFPGWTSSSLLREAGFAGVLDRAGKDRNDVSQENDEKDNSRNLRNQQQEQEQLLLPPFDLVVVLAGTNDLAHGTSSDSIFESVRGIHELALEKGCTNTIALGIPPSGWQARSEAARLLAASVNQKLDSWAAQEERVQYVPFPIQAFDRTSDVWAVDGLHFSETGYKFLGTSLAPIVAEILEIE